VLRSLLLALDGIADHAAALASALDLAQAAGAGLHIRLTLDRARLEAPEAVPLGGETFRRHAAETRAARLAARLDRLAAEIEAALRARGLEGHPARIEGDVAAEVALEAEAHDLVILSHALRRPAAQESVDAALALAPAALVPRCPRPVLLVDALSLGPGPAVAAYDGSPGSARALHAALLLGLLADRTVHVVTVAASREEAAEHAGRAALLLARHGLSAEAHALAGQGGYADEILAQIDALDPALVVMGAFGRRSWRDLLFGAVTDALLERVTPPVFLAS
jgi:nucleotide-binding universal stress UspA family protein